MERKIGEIFEYNGEWYQCLESNSCRCDYCEFGELAHCHEIACASGERSDNEEVYFKKLEKAGEPYNIGTHIYQRYEVFRKPYIFNETYFAVNSAIDDGFINIEIKQNKEDMEIYKMYDAKEDISEFDKVVQECLFGEDKLNLKPFDLQKAKQGKPVCTRDGRKARIICFDRKDNTPIVALIECVNHAEILQCVHNDGKCFHYDTSNNDLMMLPEKKEMWINIYRGTTRLVPGGYLYDTEEEAKDEVRNVENYITTVKVCWEE